MSEYQDSGYKTKSEITSWEKSYWYLRILVNTDRYGGLSKNEAKLKELAEYLLISHKKTVSSDMTEDERVEVLWNVLDQKVQNFITRRGTKKEEQVNNFLEELQKYLVSPDDYFVFATVVNEVLLPTNNAISRVPSTEAIDFAKTYAEALLKTKREKALSNLIREWDLLTEELCLNAERDILISLFQQIRGRLNTEINETELDATLTAACQEFERRVGQKRKQRAGNDLESATSFILDFFGIQNSGAPQHYTANIEVDNWVKDKKGWYIGVCLKRTQRERWKQTDVSKDILTQFHIKNIIHLINNDHDLSDSKLAQLGSNRHLFFVADDSSVLERYGEDPVLGDYLFPMSSLIRELERLMS